MTKSSPDGHRSGAVVVVVVVELLMCTIVLVRDPLSYWVDPVVIVLIPGQLNHQDMFHLHNYSLTTTTTARDLSRSGLGLVLPRWLSWSLFFAPRHQE